MRVSSARGAALAIAAAAAFLAACLDAPPDDVGGDGDRPPDASQSDQLLVNADFENGLAGWEPDGVVEVTTSEDVDLPAAPAGPHIALLGNEDSATDRMSQEVLIPADVHELLLTGQRCTDTYENPVGVFDTFSIYIEPEGGGREVLVTGDNLDAGPVSCTWTSFEEVTADHAGERIRLVLEAITDDGLETLFAVDGLSLLPAP